MLALPDRRMVRVPAQDAGAEPGAFRFSACARGLTMFTPSKDEVRRFFRETWRKHQEAQILTPLESHGTRLDHRSIRNTTGFSAAKIIH